MNCKKQITTFILAIVLVLSTASQAFANISVTLNGTQINFDVPPQIINDRTMVPLAAIFDALGASTEWDAETLTISATRDGLLVTMQIDNPVITVGGVNITLDIAPTIVDGRALAPARAIAESFGVNVVWNPATQTVALITPGFLVTDLTNPANYWVYLNGTRFAPGMTFNQFIENGLQYRNDNVLTTRIQPFGSFIYTFDLHDGNIWRGVLPVIIRNTTSQSAFVPYALIQTITVDDQAQRMFQDIRLIHGIKLGVTTPEDIIGIFGEATETTEGSTWLTLDYRPFVNNREVSPSLMSAGYRFTFDTESNTLIRVRMEFLDFVQ